MSESGFDCSEWSGCPGCSPGLLLFTPGSEPSGRSGCFGCSPGLFVSFSGIEWSWLKVCPG